MTNDNQDALREAELCDEAGLLEIGAHLRRLVRENEALRLDAGSLRMCLTCGRTKPSDEPQHDPAKDCAADPEMGNLCSFDATPQEAWQHWSRVAHERASEIAGLVQQNEAKDALLRQAVEAQRALVEWDARRGFLVPYLVRDPIHFSIAAIRQHLEGRA